jgi:hypothetical protein
VSFQPPVLFAEGGATRYSAIKTAFEEHNIEPRTPHILMAGVVSGAFTAALTNPVWVIKTRMQLQLVSHHPDHHYKNMWQGLGRMFREEGFRSFFKVRMIA